MLPSKGYFKDILCPYFDKPDGTTCFRPFCHYNHIPRAIRDSCKKQTVTAPPSTIYTPTLLKPLSLPRLTPNIVTKNKVTLEYQPEKPSFDASPSKPHTSTAPPAYVPSATTKATTSTSISTEGSIDTALMNLDDCEAELNELTALIDKEFLQEDNLTTLQKPTTSQPPAALTIKKEEQFEKDTKKSEEALECIIIKQEVDIIEISDDDDDNKNNDDLVKPNVLKIKKERYDEKEIDLPVVVDSVHIKSEKTRESNHHADKKSHREHHESKERKSSTNSSRSRHSSTSGSRNSHHKSRADEDRYRSSKEKDKHHSSERKREEQRHKDVKIIDGRNYNKNNTNNNEKHHSKDRDRHKKREKETDIHSRNKEQAKEQNTKDIKTKHDKHASSSACNELSNSSLAKTPRLDEQTSRKRNSKTATSTITSSEVNANNSNGGSAFMFSEEDIQNECLSIFNEIEAQFAHNVVNIKTEEGASNNVAEKRKSIDIDELSAGCVTQKKRIAHENADKVKGDVVATNVQRPNHMRNAMQAIHERRELLRLKQVAEAAAAAAALEEAEEKVRLANEALRKAKAESEKTLTPLIPASFLLAPTRPARSIAPISNMLALERAKRKVEELKAVKTAGFTVAQTSKGGSRVAHMSTLMTASKTKVDPILPKPPVLEANSTKISFNIRMQYYDMMVKHCLAIYPNVPDAWQRAQTEELTVFKKCNTAVIYKSSALLTINKLKKEAIVSGNKPSSSPMLMSHEVVLAGKLANNNSWSVQKKKKTDVTTGTGDPFEKLTSEMAYDMVYNLRLNEDQLIANGYPRPGLRPGTAIIKCSKPNRLPNCWGERYCSRCGEVFSLDMYDENCVDECNYHPKNAGYRRGFADNQHRCCQQPAGTPGCSYANYHVTDYVDVDNLTGFVKTIDKHENYVPSKKDIYAIDCEMCYTTAGIELTRVTVVDINARTVYDALIKPDNKIVDYNTIYSGITEKMLINETRTLRDVQAILLSMFHSKTVLVGHSLESDLKALKLIHDVVVDTSVLFPHKMGPPKKRALKTLCIENLKRIIQENVSGHDSAEDAEVCIQLVKFYLRNKIS